MSYDDRSLDQIRKTSPAHNTSYGSNRGIAIFFVIALAVVIGYNVWLNTGCPKPLETGIMTWHGKECLN